MNGFSIQELEQTRREAALPAMPLQIPMARERNVRVFRLKKGERMQLQDSMACYVSVVRGAAEVMQGQETLCLCAIAAGHPYVARRGCGTTTVTAQAASVVVCSGSDMLDTITSWAVMTGAGVRRADLTRARMARLSQSRAFRRVPIECVEAALDRMSERIVSAGEEIVTQGTTGDEFYVIWRGRAEVWQIGVYDDAPVKSGELEEGDAFGEDALITGGTRGATVRMATDGKLLVLAKADFQQLLAHPMIQEVNPIVAKAMHESGVQLLDVRYEEEYADSHIPGALLIPLHELRNKALAMLRRDQAYVVYCRSGKRSKVGALLLAQFGFQAVSMRGGIIEWPYETRGAI